MAANTNPNQPGEQDLTVHARDYAGFITLLKWSIVIVAIISAAVIFIISN